MFPAQETLHHLSAKPDPQRYKLMGQKQKNTPSSPSILPFYWTVDSFTVRPVLSESTLHSFYFLSRLHHLHVAGSRELWTGRAVRNLAGKCLTASGKTYQTISCHVTFALLVHCAVSAIYYLCVRQGLVQALITLMHFTLG